MSLQDPPVNRAKSKENPFTPKLRKNKKLELRWGNEYYNAVNMAVFSNDHSPYMPSEPPASIKKDVDKTGYVCKQCRDCFRFLSSIEEHTSRRSWILGYWCQSCFTIKCTHVGQNQLMCLACRNMEASKKAYLAEIGVGRNVKKAVIRVFYNQCQFFAHLRMHGIVMVDLNDIMLMPLPNGIQREDYGQLDKLCKALMETMFIKRVHIMDWMREMNLQPNHWNTLLNWMESKNKNPISDILARYSEDCLNAKDLAERSRKNNPLENSTAASSVNDEKDPLAENETNSPNAIAFVDCGPTPSNVLLSEFPGVNSSEGSNSDPTVERAKSLWRSFSQQYDRIKDKSHNVTPNTCKELVESSSSPATTINRKTPRVLTIRSSKSLSLSTIIKHLPIETVNTKNLLVVADDSVAENSSTMLSDHLQKTTINKPSVRSQFKSKEKRLTLDEKRKKNQKVDPTINSSTSDLDKNKNPKIVPVITKSQSFSEQISVHGRIVFQNGKKYIIRHVPKSKSQSILQDSIIKKLRNPPPLITPISGAKVPLLPKNIPATKITKILGTDQTQFEKSTSIGGACKLSKTLTKFINPAGFSLTTVNANSVSQNTKARVTKIQKTLLIKCREALMSDLSRVSATRLESYIEHLKGINERYSRTMNFTNDSVLTNNMKTITSFENMRKLLQTNEPPRSNEELLIQDNFENNIRQWETRIKDAEKNRKCETCGKILKPDSYIVGISVAPINETTYCQCYNNVCYICNANQGNLLQLRTHVKWHKGEEPYMCPSCSIVFPTSTELEVHVWTSCFHPMARYIYGCGVCEIEGILDMESIAQHFSLLHTRRKIICTECKMEYPETSTSDDYMKHHNKHHFDLEKMSEPKRLLVCSLKQCIVRPELFRAHLSEHIGVLRWIYYKCPFCTTITEGSGRNKSLMREHLIEYHLDRMHEVVSKECLSRILDGIKITPTSVSGIADTGTGQICQVFNADQTGPKILDARTITPATFEYGTEISEILINNDESKLPRILEVRSEAVEEFESEDTRKNDIRLEILSVKSISNCSPHSPKIPSETPKGTNDASISLTEPPRTITLRLNSSLIREQLECEDSSNSHEEITVISMNSKGDDSELENSFSLAETYYENGECDVKDFINAPHLEGLLTSKESSAQRPWRIALNSPTDVETKPIIYNCHLCGELINTSWSVIKNHFDTNHSSDYEIFTVSPNIPRVSMDFLEDPSSNHKDSINNNKRRKMEIVPAIGPKRRRRWGPKKHIERPGSPSFGICVKPELVQQIEGTFRCKKCDHPFEDRSMLRNHIATQHRIKGQYLICLECGENFVVVPSLQMHLKALHGIEDPITYLTKNTAYAPEILDDTEEDEKATESNQCYVCMAVFEDKPALDKHMRVHGMAFLKRRRFEALKAWKSTPKINDSSNIDINTHSIDDKSQNLLNDLGNSIKNQETHGDDKSRSHTPEDKSSKEEIQNVETTIMEIDQIETLPTAT